MANSVKVGSLRVDISGDTSELEKSLNQAENELKGFDKSVEGSVMSLGEMKREYRALSKMSLVGRTPQEVEATTKRMAFLKDAIGDTNKTIKSLSLDKFQKLAETVQVSSTLMAGLAGATSLLGGEQEKMQELMQKTVALIAIANAAQEVATFTQERAAGIWLKNKTLEIAARLKEILTINTVTASTVTENAVKTKGNIITKAITAAQWAWNAAVAANPIGLLVAAIAALAIGTVVLIARFKDNNKELEAAKKNADNLSYSIDKLNSSNKFYIDLLRTSGTTSKEIATERIKQISGEIAKNEELLTNLKKLSTETSTFGVGLSKGAKSAKEQIEAVNKSLTDLYREQLLIGAELVKNTEDRNKQIDEKNDELYINSLSGKQREGAERNKQYLKDLENWKDSESTKQQLTIQYRKNLSEINSRYANIDKREQEQAFLDMIKPIDKISVPPVDISVPVKITPEMIGGDFTIKELQGIIFDFGEEIQTGINGLAVNFSSVIGEMAVGMAGIDDVFKGVLNSVADFMSSLGKALIAAGIGAMSFKKLLANPALAIAAGGVLIGLAAAVRSKLASAPSSSPSSFSGGGISGSTTGSAEGFRGLRGQPIQVEVNGVIKASGRELLVVINNETTRTKQ